MSQITALSCIHDLTSLRKIIEEAPFDESLLPREAVLDTHWRCLEKLNADCQYLIDEAQFLFNLEEDNDNQTRKNITLLRKWYLTGAPSLVSLCIFAMNGLDIVLPKDIQQAVLLAGVLGETEHELDYHNNMHFRKVLLQVIRLINAHNHIYGGTSRAFSDTQIAMLLIGACVHDLGHDGRGNTIKGVFQPGRLEKRSIELMSAFLSQLWLDPELLADLEVMVLSTEVSPLGDSSNPMHQMKAAYRYHFLGDKNKTFSLNLDPPLSRMQNSPDLAMMSLILHEADIATSAGLSYAVTKYETAIYIHEISGQQARPADVINFLDEICERKMLSDAGQQLYASNLARIYVLAEEDAKIGNDPYPEGEYSDFLLPVVLRRSASVKRIN